MQDLEKIKGFFKDSDNREKVLTVAIIFFVGLVSFGFGRISALDGIKEPVKIEHLPFRQVLSGSSAESGQEQQVLSQEEKISLFLKEGGTLVGSKNSDKYHFPWCAGAKRIKEENKIYFNSAEEAKAKGYTPAGNCEGL